MISSTGELLTRSPKNVKPARAEVRQIWLSLTRRGAVLWISSESPSSRHVDKRGKGAL